MAVQSAHAQSSFSAGANAAGSLPDSRLARALNAAAFATPNTNAPLLAGSSARTLRPIDTAFADLAEGPFATPLASSSAPDNASLLEGVRYDSGHGLATTWDAQQFTLPSRSDGTVDSLRLSIASPSLIPGLGPRDLQAERFSPDAFDVTVTRGWPRAVAFSAGKFGVDVSPHAGLGVGNTGGSAEAGAVLRVGVGQNLEDRVADALGAGGVKDGKTFGNRERWYLFAAASGRAVGMNMLRQDGDWSRAGWSQDTTSSLVGDAQVGVGWRKGAMQTSFGYIHRSIKMKEAVMGLDTKDDSVVAFSFSLKPHN
jgi:hypothetical protein